jgi:hypothetical protein
MTMSKKGINLNIKNGQWKGDEVGYGALHYYIKHYLPKPKICSHCKSEGYIDLCNISGLYKRNFGDWEWLCRKCHMKKDGRIDKIIKANKAKGKLTIQNIRDIEKRIGKGDTLKNIAKDFNVCFQRISQIKCGIEIDEEE